MLGEPEDLSARVAQIQLNSEDEIWETDTPRNILPACPEARPVPYSLPWYNLVDQEDDENSTTNICYRICTKCHDDHIKSSPLASQFVRQQQPEGSFTLCCFFFPRIKDILWPQALISRSTHGISEFISDRRSINPCRAAEPVTSGYTIWFGLRQGDIESFHVCHACYEDRVVGTAFQDAFVIIDPTEEDVDQCVCDIGCAPYIARSLSAMAKTSNWPGFIGCALKRLCAECCSGSQVQTDSIGSWYLPVDVALKDIQICERCYLDQISHGPFEDEFLLCQSSWDDKSNEPSNEPKFRICLLGNDNNLGIALALERARQKLDFSIFVEAAKVIGSVLECCGTNIFGCNVWTLRGADFDGFIICESCYTGLSTFGLRHFFRKVEVNSEAEIYCRLCSDLPECDGFLVKLAETLDCGTFSYFFDYVKTEHRREIASDGNTDHIEDKSNEAAVRMTEYKEKSSSGGPEGTEEVLILRRCPEDRVINYSLLWYRLVNPPETKFAFLVCSRCYTDHIHNTSLAAEFEPVLQSKQFAAACNFWIPSIHDCFWPDAVTTGNTDTFRKYVSQWVESPPCPGVQGSRNYGSTWYGMVNSEVNGFMICEGCYVGNVLGTNFQNKFTSYSSEWESDTWACDLRFPFTSRALRTYAKLNDWNSFVFAAEQRHGLLLKCTGTEIYANSITWFYPRHGPISNMRICAACYMDHWALTQFDEEFQQEHRGPPVGSSEFLLFLTERWRCHVGNNLPVLMAIQEAKAENNFDIFTEAITVILESPSCSENGITYGEGWTLLGGCEGFTICYCCYSGIIWSTGLFLDFFERISWPKENVRICSFNKSAPRFELVLDKLHESLDRKDFSFFSSFVKQFASLPVCPRNTVYTGRPWWGYPQARCCVECWVDWLSHTPLAATMPLQGAVLEEGAICQMWSPRLRALWLSVCEDGEPGSDESEAAVTKFCEIARGREEIFWKTMPAIKRLQSIKYAENLNIQVQAMASVNYAGMNSLSVISGMTDGNRYGNGSIGWYDTRSGAAAAQARNSMNESIRAVSSRDAELYRLQASWREVE